MDGEDASATEFQERLDMLKGIGDPIFFRYLWMTGVPFFLEIDRSALYICNLDRV